jgi:pre-mRNA-splicing factor RBM22/SLT11
MQVCLFDLEYGLPVQVRDHALGIMADEEPQSEVGKEYKLNQAIKEGSVDSSFTKQAPNDLLLKLARTTPYYKVPGPLWRGAGRGA